MPAGADPEARGPAEGKGSDFPRERLERPPPGPELRHSAPWRSERNGLISVQSWVAGPGLAPRGPGKQ